MPCDASCAPLCSQLALWKVDAGTRVDGPAKAFAEKHGLLYAEGSAKTGEGIEEAFGQLANAMVQTKQEDTLRRSQTGNAQGAKPGEATCCCVQ